MKIKKISNKGFVLAELLIVCVFLMLMFSMLYSNFLPLQGEYEAREGYDSVDSKYAVYWIRRMIEDPDYQILATDIKSGVYIQFSCDKFTGAKQTMCQNIVSETGMQKAYITNYNLTNFQDIAKTSSEFTDNPELASYLFYLPKFTTPSLNDAYRRVIAEFDHDGIKSFATIEVRR